MNQTDRDIAAYLRAAGNVSPMKLRRPTLRPIVAKQPQPRPVPVMGAPHHNVWSNVAPPVPGGPTGTPGHPVECDDIWMHVSAHEFWWQFSLNDYCAPNDCTVAVHSTTTLSLWPGQGGCDYGYQQSLWQSPHNCDISLSTRHLNTYDYHHSPPNTWHLWFYVSGELQGCYAYEHEFNLWAYAYEEQTHPPVGSTLDGTWHSANQPWDQLTYVPWPFIWRPDAPPGATPWIEVMYASARL
jgi:hypothetical protein